MALPPEPIDEVLPDATHVVLAEVLRVISTDSAPPSPPRPEGYGSLPTNAPRQVVELKVSECLRGKDLSAGATVRAEKPVGAYALRVGSQGPFLLRSGAGAVVILGRYGPDTWRVDVVQAAMRRAGR